MKTILHLTLAAFGLAIFTNSTTAQVPFNYVTNNGTITITGGCPSSLGAVTIPDTINGLPVTAIGYEAFASCSLTNVTIPGSVTSIGDHAFRSCTELTSVIIGDSVTSIGNYAFSSCSRLTSITIPNSVTNIGDGAFSGCLRLTSVVISNSVTSIGDYVFLDCTSLTNVTIPNSVASIGNQAFWGCSGLTSITVDPLNPKYSSLDGVLFNKNQTALLAYPGGKVGSYTVPNSVTSIGEGAFSGCSGLTSITIPNSVTNIGDGVFQGCTGLTSIRIPNSVTNIGDGAFYRCTGLTSITIGSSVTSIGSDAFSGCAGLTSITVDPLNPKYSSLDGGLFSKNQSALLAYPGGKVGTYTVPNSVTTIGSSAFWGCTGLTSITIPNSVTSIGSDAFRDCRSLTSITIPDRVTSIGNGAFFDCTGLTSITIGSSVTSIGNEAFTGCTGLTSITVDPLNPNYSSLSGVLFNKTQTVLIQYPAGKLNTLLRFEAPYYRVHEDEGEVRIGVVVTGDAVIPVTVDYSTYMYDYAAEAGKDFIETKGQLSFSPGERLKYITIPIVNDLIGEWPELFGLQIRPTVPEGSMLLINVVILDNDLNPGVQFEPPVTWVAEDAGSVTLKVLRSDDSYSGAFTVDYETRDGSAKAGEDYVRTGGTLAFAPGELVKILTIPILADELGEVDEEFTVILSQPTGGAKLSTNAIATVRIMEAFKPNPLIGTLIQQVNQTDLIPLMRQLTGEEPAIVGGDAFPITTRYTASGLPILKATQFAFERLRALGLEVRYQDFIVPGYTNEFEERPTVSSRNVVAILPGEAHPDEIIVVGAHLDDLPEVGRAPGADDNASGAAAVLVAAQTLSCYRFDRTLHFVLFTGEEQGTYGSNRYVAEAPADSSRLCGVLVPDMIAYHASGPPRCSLYLPRSVDLSYPGSVVLASVFTNVVAGYNLSTDLSPDVIPRDSLPQYWYYTDTSPFWYTGLPALWIMEGPQGYHPANHTTNDTLSVLNPSYFTAMVRAMVGTAAHLARPLRQRSHEVIEVATSDWTPGSGVGGAVFYARHEADGSEGSGDAQDVAWSMVPTNSNPKSLTIFSDPYGVPLQADSRPLESETIFRTKLAVTDQTGNGISSSNQLRFAFLTPPDPDRIYLARIHVDGRHVQSGVDFDCVTNLQAVVAEGGFVQLPNLNHVADGTAYGTCDISVRLLNTEAANCRLRIARVQSAAIELLATAQLGTHTVDEVLVSTNLASHTWQVAQAYTNYVSPDAAHFEAGWTEIAFKLDASALPASATYFFQLKRTWLGR